MCFTIGDNSYSGDLYFADIEEDMLLGIDFLAKNKAIIDLSRQEVRLGDQVIVAGLVRDGVEYTTGCRVKLISRTRVPSNSITHAVAQLSHQMEQSFIFIPARDTVPCLVPATLHPKGNLATLQLVNDTCYTIYLEEGTVMGTAAMAEELLLLERGKRKVRKMQQATGRKLPEHLTDLYTRSGKGLTDEEREELQQLLVEYGDVFAAHDLDLGCFNATPHRIHLEDKTPIKQRMRRVPSGFEGEEEKKKSKGYVRSRGDPAINVTMGLSPSFGEEEGRGSEVVFGF